MFDLEKLWISFCHILSPSKKIYAKKFGRKIPHKCVKIFNEKIYKHISFLANRKHAEKNNCVVSIQEVSYYFSLNMRCISYEEGKKIVVCV